MLAWTRALLLAAAPIACVLAETVAIDASAGLHPISPLIYGVAFADERTLADLNCPLNRWGGNPTSRYNWRINADNRGSDWFFESIPGDVLQPSGGPDAFVAGTERAGARAMITIPIIGWVAKVGEHREKLCSFSQLRYGEQTASDQWFGDAGNGISKLTGKPIVGNDPADANEAADGEYHRDWITHLVKAMGAGDRWYILDNEYGLWHGTHRDVHPIGATMDECRDKMVATATVIKQADPEALVVGPEEWGWSGYLYSGFDQQWGTQHGWSGLPDRAKHGDQDFMPWLLDQLHAAEQAAGHRLVDVFSLHYYPQGGEFGGDLSPAMQLRRNRSTRSLWDPSYQDETWVAAKVRLIPRMKEWVASHDPGLRVGITEYNWGGESGMNGATTQADVLGIFGREGLDLANRWVAPPAQSPTYQAMQLYRNYDGTRSTFGDTSVSATVADPDQLSAFAALRTSDSALTVMLVHKSLTGERAVELTLAGFTAGQTAQVWRLAEGHAITRLDDQPISAHGIALALPAQSVTLLVIPAKP